MNKLTFDLYWRGHTTEKLNTFKNTTKEHILEAVDSAMEQNKVIRFKIVRCENGEKRTNENGKN